MPSDDVALALVTRMADRAVVLAATHDRVWRAYRADAGELLEHGPPPTLASLARLTPLCDSRARQEIGSLAAERRGRLQCSLS